MERCARLGRDGVADAWHGCLRATEAICKLDPQGRVIAMSQFSGPGCTQATGQAGALRFVDKEHLLQIPQIIQP